MSSDQAPVSSRYVYHHMIRHGLHGVAADRLEPSSRVVGHAPDQRVQTTIRRPRVASEREQEGCDREVRGILGKLPGADRSIPLAGVSQTFTVEWDGIRAPI